MSRAAVFRECVAALADPNVLVTVFAAVAFSVLRIAFILHACRPGDSFLELGGENVPFSFFFFFFFLGGGSKVPGGGGFVVFLRSCL